MSKANLSTIVNNITKQIEANSNLRDALNTYRHEYTANLEDLEKEALYQLEDLINTVGDPTSGEIARRKRVLNKLVQNYVQGLYKAYKNFKGEASITFVRGSSTSSFTIRVTGGQKASGKGLINVFDSINGVRTGRLLPELRDSILLDIFLANDAEAVDRAIYGNKYTNRFGKEVRGGGLFQLGHEKQGSVSVRRKAEILNSLSKTRGASEVLRGTRLSKEEKATLKLEVSTYAKKEAGRLLKEFTTTLKLNEESAKRNQGDSSRERAFLNALTREVKDHLLNKTNLFTTKTSSSSLDVVRSRLANTAKASGAKVNKVANASSSKTAAKSSISGTSSSSSGKEQFPKTKAGTVKQDKPVKQVNWTSLIGILNKKLPEQVARNMGTPALVYRTGRFANSAKVVNVETTKEGYPSIVYDYQRTPYDVFDRTLGAAPWNTPARDPRALVDKSVREIVQEMAIGRFYTRRA